MLGSRQGISRAQWRFRAILAASTMLTSGLADTAWAQVAGQVNPPPVRRPIDENGVDVTRGTFVAGVTSLSIGGDGKQGLSYKLSTDGVTTTLGTIKLVGGTYIVAVEGRSDSFTQSGSNFVSTEGEGATLTFAGNIYTYTSRDGVIARFAGNAGYNYTFYEGELARLGSITYPNGTAKQISFRVVTYCPGGYESGICNSPLYYVGRIQSVTNNNGYQLKFNYAFNDTPSQKVSDVNYADWGRVTTVTAINNAVEYCDPVATTCSLTGNWPKLTFNAASTAVTDPLGRTTNFNGASVTRPGGSSIVAGFDPGTGRVQTVVNSGVSRSYVYADIGNTRTTTVTDPNGGQKVYVSDLTKFLISSLKDELNRTTSYTYDASGRLIEAVYPEGNKVQYTYDARGNVTLSRAISKTPGTPPDIVTSAVFPASCASPITCNKPTSTTDAKGNATDITYDATHGGVLTVTAPAAAAGGIRPQTRNTYTNLFAYYKVFNNTSIVAAQFPSYKLTAVSICQTTASCSGAADEGKTTVGYGPQVAGTGNNMLPVSVTKGAGNGSFSAITAFTYDNIGNRLTVDGPLAGTADTTRTRFDVARQVVGVVGPDPDGAGALKNRAQRLTYNLDGQVTNTEVGNVNSQSDPDWAAMTVAQNVAITYDVNGRPVKQELKSGVTTYAIGQVSYDALGRKDCQTLRMDPAQWASQPLVCTPQTTGPNGADRITKAIYDAASEVIQVQTALGTADQSNEVTVTFNPNSTTATVKDGENNLTTYEYDGFDRLLKTRYPSTPQGSGTSSASDYEQLTYDANGNVTQRRLRDGQVIGFTFDNLNRVTLKDLPGSEPDVNTSYDLLGRLTQASQTGNVLGFSYDALGRNLTQSGPLGSVAYQYDLASRRTRTTWPDAFYVTYDYLVTGEMTVIRENGAASGIGVLGTYAYDNLGRRASLTRGNGTVTSTAFDPVSRLSSFVQDLAGTASDLTINGFVYNPASQIGALTRSNDAYAWSGHYNVNRNYTLNGLNQMTAAGATSLSYDGRGNLTSSGANAYSYSSENLLLTGPASAALAYDPALRLYQTVGAGITTRFQYDGSHMIGEYNTSNTLLRRYVHGPGSDESLVWYEGNGTTDRRWLHADERGSVVAISDVSGNMLGLNRYDEYGIPQATNIGRFGYTGQTWLPEIGMNYYKARIYSPTLGRFMQTDPIGYGNGVNWYNYVGSDPVNSVDSSGLFGGAGRQPDVVPICPPGDICVRAWGCEACKSETPWDSQLNILAFLDLLSDRPLYNPDSLGFLNIDFDLGLIIVTATSLLDAYKKEVCDGPANSKGTLQIGLAGIVQLGPVAIPVGAGLAFDRHGSVAGYDYAGGGTGSGNSGVAGPSIQLSNAQTTQDLSGPFNSGSATFGDGFGGTVDVFTGSSAHGDVAGGGVTLGPGGGASVFGGKTGTNITPLFNAADIFKC